jgi:hypothetical protein
MYLMKKSAAIRAPFMSVTVNEPFLCRFYVNRVFWGLLEIFVCWMFQLKILERILFRIG